MPHEFQNDVATGSHHGSELALLANMAEAGYVTCLLRPEVLLET
jgi:hypothetical protein